MKRIPMAVVIALALVLVVFGVCYGIISGCREDRVQTVNLLNGDGGLKDVLFYRGADGINFCKVAGRYLASDDEDYQNLLSASRILTDEGASLASKKQADDSFDTLFENVSTKITGFLSERDSEYEKMLKKDMQSWSASNASESYNQAAIKFNAQLSSSITGLLVKLFGIQPCELFE